MLLLRASLNFDFFFFSVADGVCLSTQFLFYIYLYAYYIFILPCVFDTLLLRLYAFRTAMSLWCCGNLICLANGIGMRRSMDMVFSGYEQGKN